MDKQIDEIAEKLKVIASELQECMELLQSDGQPMLREKSPVDMTVEEWLNL